MESSQRQSPEHGKPEQLQQQQQSWDGQWWGRLWWWRRQQQHEQLPRPRHCDSKWVKNGINPGEYTGVDKQQIPE
jgi:hypothetical protein